MSAMAAPQVLSYKPHLRAPGTRGAPFRPVLAAEELPPGSMRRVTDGDLDVLLAHTPEGIVAVDDRCPHMSAPLSIGLLEGCVVQCPLHEGRFDLCSGDPVRMPTTGGLDPDGVYHPTWSPAGLPPKTDPPGLKAEARRLTRIRRFRYYPVRIVNDTIEVALPYDPTNGPSG
jgi:3-phenylpropionate/trans-cinnamate dioxygenase ferredoxin component